MTELFKLHHQTWSWQDGGQGGLTGWSQEERRLHINELELLPALFALKAFLKHVQYTSVLLKSDNVTTVAYINRLGGRKSHSLVEISKELWAWCLHRGIVLQAQHLLGRLNINADFIYRTGPTGCSIQQFSRSSSSPEVLWPTQAWFPQLLQMLTDHPLALPEPVKNQVIMPSPNCDCPVRVGSPQLVAWRVSGNSSERKRFQRASFSPHRETRLTPHTILHGISGAGVLPMIPIPFRLLLQTFL